MQEQYRAKIKEIFTSIQGEGPYIGEKHLFVRFCSCNLNCDFCDTDFNSSNSKAYTIDELFHIISNLDFEKISFTGGEPLLEADFLLDFLLKYKSKLNKKIYLETNGILFDELKKIINYVDIIASDIKLQSATRQKNRFSDNEKFIKIASVKEVFIKVVFDKNIKDEEINNVINIAKTNNTLVILQPKMPMDNNFLEVFDKFYLKYKNIRLIPQVHKFLNIE